jgi:outer membrane receptor protein involved in Fe transport
MSFSLGSHIRFSENTDASLSYTFTRAKLEYDDNASANIAEIADNRDIDSDVHGVQLEVRHWLRDGLRVQAGYRLQRFDDSSARRSGTGSVVQPIDPSQTQHTVTLGVTLNSDLFVRSEPEPLPD